MVTKKKSKPMSPETEEKGRQFVAALLEEQQDYRSMNSNFRCVVARMAMEEKGNVRKDAARLLGMTPQGMGKLLDMVGLKRTVVLKEIA